MVFKRHITADQFGWNDDRITDLLFDKVGFSPSTRKFTNDYIPLKIPEKDIVAALEGPARRRNELEAVTGLLNLLDLRGYQLSMPLHFRVQLELYVKIYLPDCSFEINTTTSYSNTPEACVTARKPIEKGVIMYLCGILVPLTEEEEQTLAASRDFSIVTSSRKKSSSLFLGPGRFANHDCEANAELSPTEGGMQIVAIRHINIGEEITVSYGNHYFGKNNCECLCATCASLQRNGWTMGNKEAGIPASLTVEDDEKYPVLRAAKLKKRRNRRLRIRPRDVRTSHCAVCRLNGLTCLRCKRHLKLYGCQWPETHSGERKEQRLPTLN